MFCSHSKIDTQRQHFYRFWKNMIFRGALLLGQHSENLTFQASKALQIHLDVGETFLLTNKQKLSAKVANRLMTKANVHIIETCLAQRLTKSKAMTAACSTRTSASEAAEAKATRIICSFRFCTWETTTLAVCRVIGK